MLQLISLVIIFGAMMFIWTFVFLNRSHDRINQSFLIFLSNILIWMVLDNLDRFSDGTIVAIVVKTVYWLSMMYLSISFLYFAYRLLLRKPDRYFYFFLVFNTAMIVVRYLYPIDYSDPTFWRMSDPIVAPLMSLAFSLPALFALYLVLRRIITTKDTRQRAQLGYVLGGIGLALVVSVLSEYVLPTVFQITKDLYLMYYAIVIFVVAIFVSIMRYRLLNLRSDYIFRNLFLNANEAILLVNRDGRILSINHVGREILHDDNLDTGVLVTSVLPEYRFDAEYHQQEVQLERDGQTRYLTMTQYPLEERGRDTTKLLLLADVTQARREQEHEKEKLIEKSSVDPLTGLFNKLYLRKKYGEQPASTPRRTSLLFIDVDDFKSINDRFGHLTGDDVLRELAACIKQNIRGMNDATRFGGDEFVVVLEDATADEAYIVAERIRICANALEFFAGDTAFHITLSIGLIEGTGPLDELIEKADRAMYDSKNKGKNTTTRFS